MLQPDFTDKQILEKYSAAFTLSDMEIFIFPQLLYPLVIANIMSPILWSWRDDPWFRDMEKKNFNYKINRVKQYIIDHYVFNLDLETWGLTDKKTEIDRFKDFMDMELLKQSNALFGYEGDKYYFDIDIRRHFGLDSYQSDIIPYWKTETIEAMTAFQYKELFSSGAGECVSLSALYAAALFVVGRIPLESIFMIGTPLHSQNFIELGDGVITNNRRIVTKKMWFNGTSMSAKARRALENEKITIVAHVSGYIHYVFTKATIDPLAYERFSKNLKNFLHAKLSASIFINFLRYHMNFKECFQYKYEVNGKSFYIGLDKIFEYEHDSKFSFEEHARTYLLQEIDDEEFSVKPLGSRLFVHDIEQYLNQHEEITLEEFRLFMLKLSKESYCGKEDRIDQMTADLNNFLTTVPQLPNANKDFERNSKLSITLTMNRDEIIKEVIEKSGIDETAHLTLYAFRQMDKIDWNPFLKASLERNPVANNGLKDKTLQQAYLILQGLVNTSIYDGVRLALPDEVWNFQRGDGLEKAIVLASFAYRNDPNTLLSLNSTGREVVLQIQGEEYAFTSSKGLIKKIQIS